MGLIRIFKRHLIACVAGLTVVVLLYVMNIKYSPRVKCKESCHTDQRISQSNDEKTGINLGNFGWKEKLLNNHLKSTYEVREQTVKEANFRHHKLNLKSGQEYGSHFDSTFEYSQCRMSNCFNFSRCQSKEPMKVHIVPSIKREMINSAVGESNSIHQNVVNIIRQSKHFEPDPDKACLFVLEDDTFDRDPLSQSFKPDVTNIFGSINNYGMNYLVFNLYSGSWPEYREEDFAGLQFGAAILAKASNSLDHHRPGFDVSLPLFSYLHPVNNTHERSHQSTINNGSRNYFLTFKGKRYVFGRGSETRNSLYHLNNQKDVIMLTTCRHGKKWRESSDDRCPDDEINYDQYDFKDLMKESTFCLTPRGRRLGSFRYLEALSFGCIPVILSDGWVKPFDELIDWSCASFHFAESLLLQVPDMLREVKPVTAIKMRNVCIELYNKYFSSMEKIILTTLSIIEKRIKNNSNLTSQL